MKLNELDPKWLIKDGKRVGFTFVSPTNPQWRQSCFAVAGIRIEEQMELFGDDDMQPCNSKVAWHIKDGIEAADFATMTVTPSLDGAAGGLWHGNIIDGQIVGGI